MKRDIVERTNKAEIIPEEQSRKAESCRKMYESNTVERASRTEQKGMDKLGWFVLKTYTTMSPPHGGEPERAQFEADICKVYSFLA